MVWLLWSEVTSVKTKLTNNEQSKKEIKEIMPFTIASKRKKCLGRNLTMEAKDLYTGNC